ncbi:purine-cytosine permease family protein [Amycolatopsis jejuensis]|uniref:purine-cytosine permease family protein n=1 Tax=Amycolatopsis jejuensis TaxID=330084 RepID=UPI000525C3AA|nr:cytosine permease [Amycolatopsis jejuensis]
MTSASPAPRGGIELHSIDYVPRGERHGKAWHQAPFWFTGEFVITTAVTGFVGPLSGLSFGWSALSVVLGVLFGTFFMAFHANQGPTMGLPQMIQSRAQFGSRGVILPLLLVMGMYIGLTVFGVILATEAIQTVLPGGPWLWYPVVIVAAAGVAIVGYDLLHLLLRWLTFLVVPIFGIITIIAVVTLEPSGGSSFSVTGFLAQFGVAAGYQIGYAVYVSDYSRYLPAKTPARQVIGWTYLGAVLGSIWLMVLGSLIASSLPNPDAVGSLRQVGDSWFGGFGTFAVVATIVPSCIAIMGVNSYGAMLSALSIVEGFRKIRPTRGWRVLGIALCAGASVAIATVMPADFVGSFSGFITLLLYALVPWTAVNLVDYYVVRRGHYAIAEILAQDGIYGRWGWRGLGAYLLGMAAMVPFMVTPFYVGPVAEALGGADIAFAVGLLVGGLAYFLMARGHDLTLEQAAIARSEALLEPGELVSDGAAPAS